MEPAVEGVADSVVEPVTTESILVEVMVERVGNVDGRVKVSLTLLTCALEETVSRGTSKVVGTGWMLVVESDTDSVTLSEMPDLQPLRGLVCPPTLISTLTSTSIGILSGTTTELASPGSVVAMGGTKAVIEGAIIPGGRSDSIDGKVRRDVVDWELVIALREASEVVEAFARPNEDPSMPNMIVGVEVLVCGTRSRLLPATVGVGVGIAMLIVVAAVSGVPLFPSTAEQS